MCTGHNHSTGHGDHANLPTPWWRTRPGLIVLSLFAVVASYFLWTQHRSHVVAALPFAVFLACPLMHLFMHRGHHGHGRAAEVREDNTVPRQPRP